MKNKVTWKREENGSAVPYMFECHNDRWMWVRYNRSHVAIPDPDSYSKGYMSFLNAKKHNYQLEVLQP